MFATISVLSCLTFHAAPPEEKKEESKPRFTVGKASTFVEGPLDKDGRIDYAAALNERLGKGVTPENNTAVLLWKAMGPTPEGGNGMPANFYKLLGIERPSEKENYFTAFALFYRALYGIPPAQPLDQVDAIMDRATSRPWTPAAEPDVAEWLRGIDKPLALVIEATKRTQYYSPLVSQTVGLINFTLQGVQKCRAMANALIARAMLKLGRGDTEAAWADLIACHRLGAQVARGGTNIEFLVGLAIDGVACKADLVFLDRVKSDAKRLESCQRDLQTLTSSFPALADSFDLAERFIVLDAIMMADRGGLKVIEALAGGDGLERPLQKQVEALIDWDPALESVNKWYDRLAAALRERDRPTRGRKLNEIDADLKALREKTTVAAQAELGPLVLAGQVSGKALGQIFGDVVICLMLSTKTVQSEDRAKQNRDNLLIAFALARYRADNGNYPKELSLLVPKYLKEVPKDRFSGKPLIYTADDKGYILYSVGINGQDDGGRGPDDTPKGDDLAVRMPLELPKK